MGRPKKYTDVERIIMIRFNSMISRCNKKSNSGFKYYGGRGICVCRKWRNDPRKFLVWALNNGFKKELSIDRIDNDKGYAPFNCQWITLQENLKKSPRVGRKKDRSKLKRYELRQIGNGLYESLRAEAKQGNTSINKIILKAIAEYVK